jgi:hypothetical protein
MTNEQSRDRRINCPVCHVDGTATIQYKTGYIIVTHTHKCQCYMGNDAEKRMVMEVLIHWSNFESKALPRLIKYGTLENVKKYFPNNISDLLKIKKEEYISKDRRAKRLRNIQYREGEKVELIKNGKTFLTEIRFNYSRRSNKTQKKCPKCGQLGRELKDFHAVDKKGYYDVYYLHKVGNVRFIDVNTRKSVKSQQVRTKCKVGKGYTVEMMFNAMNNEKKLG